MSLNSFSNCSFLNSYKQKVIEENPGMVKNKDELIDGQLSGKYLIISLKHCFTKEDNTLKYIQKALVIKDGLGVAP